MAVGTQYSVAENGWIRFEENNSNFEYSTGWTNWSGIDTSGGTDKRTNTVGQTIKFGFIGNSIRIIAPINKDLSNSIKISIDGKEEDFTEYNATLVWRVCVYEKTGLSNKKHSVVITTNSTATNILDAVDLVLGSSIIPYQDSLPIRKMVLQNPSNSTQYYSLSDNTLIHLPDNSHKNMILHGIEQGKEVQLDVPFDKHRYFNDTPVANVSGKVFTHDIGKINTLSIKEIRENKSIVTTWYETNMTSNNTPTPLVASASSIYSNDFMPYIPFSASPSTGNTQDCWASVNGVTNGWLKIDYGKEIIVNTYRLRNRYSTSSPLIANMPKTWTIEASNNNSDWTTIHSVNNYTNWVEHQESFFTFDNTKKFRYYRINISQINGGNNYVAIGKLLFGAREVK
ncbi:discoidin domain-containing protein [Lysinibacillus sp. Ag94]|uniref:discoidin domain-containing protein n=1 Tax=Lysinibacillus sp. Ag94 TaxID=2936682 RepID=UPI0020108FA1|nr:discoidin domain-containing protein [Lysinibacillus sp. Ag94]UPW81594.1 discoidin domain-containing protein [Lysinibacillus sp. Ag94]